MDTKYDLENVVQNKFWSIFMITDIQSTCLLIQIDVFTQQTLRDTVGQIYRLELNIVSTA